MLLIERIQKFVQNSTITKEELSAIPFDISLLGEIPAELLTEELESIYAYKGMNFGGKKLQNFYVCFDKNNHIYLDIFFPRGSEGVILHKSDEHIEGIYGKQVSEDYIFNRAAYIENERSLEKDNILTPTDISLAAAKNIVINAASHINDNIVKFEYQNPESETRVVLNPGLSSTTRERKNEIIDALKRKEILESYSYLYKALGRSNTRDIEYMIYIYKLDEVLHKIIFEPTNGKSYTKIANFNIEKPVEEKGFVEFSKRILESKEDFISRLEFITRHAHRSEETYSDLIACALGAEHNLNYGTANTINNTLALKIEKLS